MCVDFIDLEKVYDGVNGKVLWKVLRMYEVSGELLSGIKSVHIDSLPYVRVK